MPAHKKSTVHAAARTETVQRALKIAKGELPPVKTKSLKAKLTIRDMNFVEFTRQFYMTHHSGLPTIDEAAQALGYPTTELNYMLLNKNVQEAFEIRGIPWQHFNGNRNGLTSTQVAAATVIMNFSDVRPTAEKLDQLGLTPAQWQAWLQNPEFKAYVNNLASDNINNVRPEAVTQYTQHISKGNLKAIQHYFEVTGEFGDQTSVNIQALLQMVVESIQKHVKDPLILASISADLMNAVPQISSSQNGSFGRANVLNGSIK
jgi:hypothetical protein